MFFTALAVNHDVLKHAVRPNAPGEMKAFCRMNRWVP
jgi:hypothetical protein